MFSTTTSSSSKPIKLISQIYKVNGVLVCSNQCKSNSIDLEGRAKAVLSDVEQGLLLFHNDFHNDFKHVLG